MTDFSCLFFNFLWPLESGFFLIEQPLVNLTFSSSKVSGPIILENNWNNFRIIQIRAWNCSKWVQFWLSGANMSLIFAIFPSCSVLSRQKWKNLDALGLRTNKEKSRSLENGTTKGRKDRPHCYSIRSNLKKMGPFQFCLQVFLGIHRNPKQKQFL